MKKFKIDKNLSTRLAALSAAGIILVTGLTGCAKKPILKNTILEASRVISFEDNHKDIAIISTIGCSSSDCGCEEEIYKSIITNEFFATTDCKSKKSYNEFTADILNHYNIVNSESIISYLTDEEIKKATDNTLSDEDVSKIINRILENEQEKNLAK